MTAATPFVFIEENPSAGERTVSPSVDVAGVRWPLYKVRALVAMVIVAGVVFVATGSGQLSMWASATAMLTVWWGGRLLSAIRSSRAAEAAHRA